MKYFSRPYRESAESTYLVEAYGKHYEPFGTISLSDQTVLGTGGVVLEDIAGETLAIHPRMRRGHFSVPASQNGFGNWMKSHLAGYAIIYCNTVQTMPSTLPRNSIGAVC